MSMKSLVATLAAAVGMFVVAANPMYARAAVRAVSDSAQEEVEWDDTEADEPSQDVDVNVAYGKTRSLTALLVDSTSDAYAGTATISIGKIKKGKIKVSVKMTPFSGSSASASATVAVAEDGSAEGLLKFKKLGDMEFVLGYDADENSCEIQAENEKYALETVDGKIGGTLEATELSFSADVDLEAPDGYDFETDLPSGEPIYVTKGTKWSFDKAPSIKFKKYKEDDMKWYELEVNDADGEKTNVSGLKLSYKAKTGLFSGSFTVYASNQNSIEEGKSPKLAKYKATVKGVMVDGAGYGAVVIKVGKNAYTGSCTIE